MIWFFAVSIDRIGDVARPAGEIAHQQHRRGAGQDPPRTRRPARHCSAGRSRGRDRRTSSSCRRVPDSPPQSPARRCRSSSAAIARYIAALLRISSGFGSTTRSARRIQACACSAAALGSAAFHGGVQFFGGHEDHRAAKVRLDGIRRLMHVPRRDREELRRPHFPQRGERVHRFADVFDRASTTLRPPACPHGAPQGSARGTNRCRRRGRRSAPRAGRSSRSPATRSTGCRECRPRSRRSPGPRRRPASCRPPPPRPGKPAQTPPPDSRAPAARESSSCGTHNRSPDTAILPVSGPDARTPAARRALSFGSRAGRRRPPPAPAQPPASHAAHPAQAPRNDRGDGSPICTSPEDIGILLSP